MNEHEKLVRAKQQVDAMTGFYGHLAAFALVMVVLFIVNALSSSTWWSQWVFLGWGAGVLGHALLVFGRAPSLIRDWQLRKIREIKDKM